MHTMTASADGMKGNRKRKLFAVGCMAAVLLLLMGILLPVTVSKQNALLQAVHAGVKSVSASGGYIIEHDGFYYYANPSDGNRLYRADTALENPKKLSDHANGSPYIQLSAAGTRLFYLQSIETGNDTVQKRLCVYDLGTEEEMTVFDKNVVSYIIVDDWIYCETVSPVQTYRLRLDGSSIEKVGNEYPNAVAITKWGLTKDALIYTTHEGMIKYDPVSGQAAAFQAYSADFAVDGTEIYSINYDDNFALEQYNAETMSYADKKRVVSRNVHSFALFDKTLVYAAENGLMWSKNLEGKGRTFLTVGYNPIICGRYLFYINRNDRIGYLGMSAEGIL